MFSTRRAVGSGLGILLVAVVIPTLTSAPRSAATTPVKAASVTKEMAAAGQPTDGGLFGAIDQVRILDTRTGVGAPVAEVAAGASVEVELPENEGFPPGNTAAIAASVTVVGPTSAGTLAVSPLGASRRGAVIANFRPPHSISSTAVLPIGIHDTFVLTNNSRGSVHLVVDATGFYRSGTPATNGAFGVVEPVRLLDSRVAVGTPRARLAPGRSITVTMTGRGGVPRSGVSAIAGAVTVVSPGTSGTLAVAPAGSAHHGAVVLNFRTGESISTGIFLPLGVGGRVVFTNVSAGTIDLVTDVTGYFTSGPPSRSGAYGSVDPSRVLDTRTAIGGSQGRIAPGGSITVGLAGPAGVPGIGVSRIIAAVSVVVPLASGTLSIAPAGRPAESATVLNFAADQSISGVALLPVGSGGRLTLTNNSNSSIHLVIDDIGFHLDRNLSATPTWQTPQSIYQPMGTPHSISCVDDEFCMVADGGRTFTFAGGSWTPVLPGREQIAVTCESRSACLAFGNRTSMSWTGTSWADLQQIVPPSRPAEIIGAVDCVGVSFCMAISDTGNAYRYSTDRWSAGAEMYVSSDYSDQVTDVSCSSVNRCAAVTSTGKYLIWDGRSWSAPVATRVAANLNVISCSSASLCTAISSRGRVIRYDGATWRFSDQLGDPNGQQITDLSCPTAGRCMASGYPDGYLFDGDTWRGTGTGQGYAVDCRRPDRCAIGTLRGVTMWEDWVFQEPAVFEADFDNGLRTVSCTDALCMVSTTDSATIRVVGGRSTEIPVEAGPAAAVDCFEVDRCVAVGNSGAWIFDGAEWSEKVRISGLGTAFSVSCTGPTFCVAITDTGFTMFDGETWSAPEVIDPAGGITSVSCVSEHWCMATTSRAIDQLNSVGEVLVFDGQVWSTATTISPSGGIWEVSCATQTFCAAVGSLRDTPRTLSGFVAYFDGTDWTTPAMVTPDGAGLERVSCTSATFCAGTDGNGGVYSFDGALWRLSAVAGTGNSDVSCSSDQRCSMINMGDGSITPTRRGGR
ncbi:hypothetical protein GIS00_14560 [Nakamurella sp. YIM 132087]|uniref:Choice-of-anchor D domain-containing protein n=1 Tax=Nakamurella alba TaxID=2665158 RepID=A0A7K1FLY7_9ACTN|nr:hypothetical protein [Nakamurella alba]MTD15162.1 hypothetical protein [Nakamurella alba]